MTERKPDHCQLCERPTRLTYHHLIPKKMHRRTRFQKQYGRDELNRGIWVCRKCHNGIHRLYDEMTLAKQFASLDALKQDPSLQRHVHWVRKQKS
ncbi:HNH endonuclease [Reinekea blandensis]|uniref:HNH domain-containing protein n=1 Tax=Reinekea blandensis MED297 TaxID=314283 RepID=A4BBE0_9GAMM|nr:HNH endonuclease [Reinekea blandensis]EAR10753.1 hypothetical protein MED297_12075 [Reinekea sp. MED297] [Reinekea blandensis MED297]